MWWLLNGLAVAGLATVGEALSLKIELRDISVGSRGEDDASDSNSRREKKDEPPRDVESGFRSDEIEPAGSRTSIEKSSLVS